MQPLLGVALIHNLNQSNVKFIFSESKVRKISMLVMEKYISFSLKCIFS